MARALTNTSAVVRGVVFWSAVGCAIALFVLSAFPLYNVDAYGHLAQGRQIAELGYVPTVDLFSFWKPTPQPWSNYEWGYDLVTWFLYDRFGPNALILTKCLALGALGFVLVLLADRLACGAALAAPFTTILAIVAAPFARIRFTVRPQIVGLLLPAVLLLGIGTLYSPRRSPRAKLWVVVGLGLMHVAWVNLHGSHLLGLLITALFLAFSVRTTAFRSMALLLVLQLAATACTPFGAGIVTDAIAHLWNPEYREVVIEWAPWSPAHPLYLLMGPVVAALFVLVTMRPVTRASRYGLAYGVFCVVVSLMAFRSMRFVGHQLLFTAPFVAAGFAMLDRAASLRRSVPWVAGLAFLGAVWFSPKLEPFVPFGFGEPRLGHAFAAAKVVDQHLEEPRILAPIQDSWPLMFAVSGGRFLIDGRVPFYGPEFIRAVTNSFSDQVAFERVLRTYDVNAVVVDHTRAGQTAATELLWRSPDWALGQVENRQSLFIRAADSQSLKPLVVVAPGYRVGRLLDSDVSEGDITLEVEHVGEAPGSGAIQAWIAGVRSLRPLARDGDRAGIRLYQTAEEREAARKAYRLLSQAVEAYPGFTSIELYRAMAATAACDVTEARTAVSRAKHARQTRDTVLVEVELDLRAGDAVATERAKEHVRWLASHPGSDDDAWVVALAADLDTRCP
jgi:hypothetical protein